MDLRDYLSRETAALADRLTEAFENAIRETKRASNDQIEALRAESEAAHAELAAQAARIAALTAEHDAEFAAQTERLAVLAAERDAARADAIAAATARDSEAAQAALLRDAHDAAVADLRAQLDGAEATARAKEAELLAATTQLEQLRATTSADVEQLRADAQAASTEIERLRVEAITAAAELERLRGESAAAAADADVLREAATAVVAERDAQRARADALAADLEALRAQADAAATELDVSKQQASASAAERDTLRQQADAVHAELRTLRDRAQADAEKAARVDDADATLAGLRAELAEAQQIADAASAEMTALRERTRKATTILADAAKAVAAIDAEGTVDGIFATLVRQLQTAFARTAIFRLHGNHLEGDLAAGVDGSVDVKKIVIPRSLGSLITKAASGGGLQVATPETIAEARPPFGGSPASALAAPLVFEGDTLAVVYADSDVPFSEAHAPLASVLVRHTNARLTSLSQELKAAKGLRDYARTLLQELEQMFQTDVHNGVAPNDRLRRLRDSLGFARDLYAQRAALDAPTSANLLEEEIAGAIDTESRTPFAHDLAIIVLESRGARRNAS